jgi:NAD dependent epimerase/dehydratase family enzyme
MSRLGGALKRQLPLFRLGLGGPLGNGRQWLSPISLRDEIRAILWIIDHQMSGPVNLVCPTPLTNAEFARRLAQALHRLAIVRTPAAALKVVLGAQLTSEAILASQRVLPSALLESGFVFDDPDATSIINEVVRLRTN